jgi:hypothetical protein
VIDITGMSEEEANKLCWGSLTTYLGDERAAPCRKCGLVLELRVMPRPFRPIYPSHYAPGTEPK